MSRILDEILATAKMAQQKMEKSLAIFDLDSTLFCVSPRTQAILNSLSKDDDLKLRFPDETPQLAALKVSPLDWGIRSVIVRHQLKGSKEFFSAVREKWADRFFSSEHLEDDIPYPGAVEFVSSLNLLGVEIRYLTGRDRPRMGEGTIRSLNKHGFPLANPDHLHMKPDSNRHDAEFKRDTLMRLIGSARKVWFFENEPVIINLVQKQLPDLKIIFMDSVHSGREQPPQGLPQLNMTFERSKKD